jgi:acetate kinase
VVHGGPRFADPTILDPDAIAYLESLIPLARLHQPHNLAPVRELAGARPGLVQVACFDTAFHRGHPDVADRYALPLEFHVGQNVRRYGFHGLSYECVSRRLRECDPAAARGRVVVAHLGNGASMCAAENGRSVDCSMGFSTLGGLPMGTRCGDLDPGVVLHLLRAHGMSVDALEELLSRRAGLLGLSGISNDMRALLASDAPEAAAAIDYFLYHVAGELGRLAAVMGGLDAFVFTAGIGERSPEIRARVCTSFSTAWRAASSGV